ncbi:MAG: fibronectin type III domain-containing protein [Paludibacteraceae bacterium]|nr:fibronectin type III domain-containing protein [Paludibacteraceae bacterium]
MKNFLSVLSSTLQGGIRGGLLILTLLATTSLWAYDFQSGDLYYNITSDSTVAVTYQEYNSSSNYASIYTVTVPETVTYDSTTYSVTSIGGDAFSYCRSLTAITIPESVTSIGGDAFSYCRSLTAITIPESVTDIGSGAFESCSSLTSVVWNAKKCGNRNSYNDGYTHFYFEIEFADSTSYSYEEIDEFVKQHFFSEEYSIINDSPFNGCDAIKSFSFGENVEFIPDGLCYGLDSITSITIPKSVWIIGERSFGSCGSLDTIYCYSEDFPVIRLTYLDVVVNMEMIFSYDADAPYIYDNTILYVPCQLLDAYKSQEEYTIRFPNIQCLEDTPPSEPQDTTIYHPTEYVAICEGTTFVWMGMEFTAAGTYTHEEIVEDENYIYHYIHTLELQVIAPPEPDTIVVEAYDSYEWHGVVYTESGTYIYEEHCYQEILQLTIIPSEDKEYVYGTYYQDLVCNQVIYVDPITGENHLISSLDPTSLTWSDTVKGTEVDTIHTFNITPIVCPEPLTEDMLYAIGAVPKLVAGEEVDLMGTTELIMAYYQMVDQHDIADVIGVEWVLGHDVVLDAEQTTHTMMLEVVTQCDDVILMEFTFPVSKKDSAPQDTTIYHPTVYETICEGTTFTWMGMDCTEAGLYEYHEIVEGEDYTYHHIYTLELTILPYKRVEYEMIAYDSYEWHGWVYTESGTHTYQSDECTIEVLYLTIIPSGHNQGEVVVEPSTNSVTITWQKEESADSYIIVIKQGDKVICTLIFDAEGNLVSVNYLPGRESNKHGIQHAGLTSDSFQYTITGLTPSTDYTYTVTAMDDSDNTISSYSGEFTTHHATSVENTNSQSPTSDCQKILYEDHIYILRDGKTYTIMGQEL